MWHRARRTCSMRKWRVWDFGSVIFKDYSLFTDDDSLPEAPNVVDEINMEVVTSPTPASSRSHSHSSMSARSSLSRQSSASASSLSHSPAEALKKSLEKALNTLYVEAPKLKKIKELRDIINSEKYPDELREVARLCSVLPVTQVSVERLFSALKIYKSDLRSCLKVDIIDDMLLIKANKWVVWILNFHIVKLWNIFFST